MSAGPIRAIFFDAVGTLIHPEPSAAAVYAGIGTRFGSRLGTGAIRTAFAEAFARQDQLDRDNGWKTDEAREVQRWRSIVGEVLPDVPERERDSCFVALYEHFGQPANWRCDPAADKVIGELGRRGYRIGIASNFDRRLRQVLSGFRQLAALQPVVISSEVGWRKPAAAFFQALARAAALAPREVLYVGDDFVNDFDGARSAGCQALLVGPRQVAPEGVRVAQHLAEVLDLAH
jgi:putative hydrolase of the HAD superfamily